MKVKPLKTYLPRGLYGRAALILLLPVISLQLLVSVVFIQRHFEGVTRSMTRSVAQEIELIVESSAADRVRLAAALDMQVLPLEDAPNADIRATLDLSGRAMIETLRLEVENVDAVDLSQDSVVRLWIGGEAPLGLSFRRHRVAASNPHQLLVIMVVMGTVLTLIAFVFLRNQLRPIRRLAIASAEYGKGRVVPYTPSGALEVRAAGTAFLEMRTRLERQIQSRNMMLSGISHDLRTPLTRLRLGLSFMDDEEAKPMVDDVEDMERLIAEFLDYGRAEVGDAPEKVAPAEVVRPVVEKYQAAGSNVTLVQPTQEVEAIRLRLRPLGVQRVLDNLIGNALRYGGDTCHVSLALTDRTLRLTVEDDGPGIPADRREEAIRPFTRLDPARNQNKGSGVGLGLAIVADIARLHGGSLRLSESADLGGLQVDVIFAR